MPAEDVRPPSNQTGSDGEEKEEEEEEVRNTNKQTNTSHKN
jgi:hypothetical protein